MLASPPWRNVLFLAESTQGLRYTAHLCKGCRRAARARRIVGLPRNQRCFALGLPIRADDPAAVEATAWPITFRRGSITS